MRALVVYSRRGCHLCEELIEELLPLVCGRARIEVRDIDTREEWRCEYDVRVPVVEFEGHILCEFRLDRTALDSALAEVDERGARSA